MGMSAVPTLRARPGRRVALAFVLRAAAGLGLATLGCGSPTESDGTFTAAGTVRLGLEGCMVLVTSEETYLPRNLPTEFAREGIRVRFTARRIPAPPFTVCGIEPRIELLCIQRAL